MSREPGSGSPETDVGGAWIPEKQTFIIIQGTCVKIFYFKNNFNSLHNNIEDVNIVTCNELPTVDFAISSLTLPTSYFMLQHFYDGENNRLL